MFSLDKIYKQIDFEYEYGIREFEISGGEPSEYSDLRTVCEYIKSKPKKTKIAIITNGGLFASDVWDLIDEVLVSYHTPKDNNLVDKTVFPLGSTYPKVKKTIDKAHKNNILVRTNTVLATFNIDQLHIITDELIQFNPAIINFLPINLFDNADKSLIEYIDYDKVRNIIKQQIDKINSKLSCQINVRYMPFCKMEGYEKYIVGTLQHIYDSHDWNRELGGTELLEYINNYDSQLERLGEYGSTSIDAALTARNIFYEKATDCLACKYYLICDGVEKTPDKHLLKYICPSKGKIIKNFIEYRKND